MTTLNAVSNIILMAVLLVIGSGSLNAQVVKYRFTVTSLSSTAAVGESISGTITLDTSATPDLFGDFPNGQFGQWQNGKFAANAITDTGFVFGTALGGSTHFDMQDIVTTPIVETSIETLITYATHQNGMWIDSRSHVLGDGLINIQDPWTPLDEEEHFIFVVDYNFDTQEYNFGMFSIDTFEVVITNIMVNGIDTGIQDFQYHGQYVTQTISNFQAASKNHGAYVSSVTKLINSLRQDSLLTAAQRSTILDIVTKKTH